MTIVLGIDPGSRVTGYGLVSIAGHRVKHIANGCFRLGDDALDERLLRLFDGLAEVIREHQPHEAAIEKVFMNRNADSALKLGHARGVAMLCSRQAGLQVAEYAATKIKQAIVGRGHAEKGQVQHMVRALLELDETPQADAADALAAAICHAHMREGIARIALAGGAR